MDSADRQGGRWRKYDRLKTRIEATGGEFLPRVGSRDLKKLTALVVAELDRSYAAFAAFQALVGDWVAYVTEKNSEMLATIDRDPAAGPGLETGSA